RSDQDGFLVEATVEEENDALIRRLVKIWNTRLRIMQLLGCMSDLAQYGPMKPEAQHGLDEVKEKFEGASISKGANYRPDPAGKRCGNGVSEQLQEVFDRVCKDADAVVSAGMVKARQAVAQAVLNEKIENMRGAVAMAYPMGLPEWDPVRLIIEGEAGLGGTGAQAEVLDPDTAGLWLGGKEFRREETVGDRVGKNEKTKVICRLQGKGAGAPAREPAVNEEERKAMMAFYFKKQEEMKKLAEASDDDYLTSSWADPKQLQNSLRGTGSVRAPGI
ncbi:unnamed protein product, partial [Chrysoparadoxa australica]